MAWLTPALNGAAPAGMIDVMDSALCDGFVGTNLTESPGLTLMKPGSKTIAPADPEFSILTVTIFASPGLARTNVRAKIANLVIISLLLNKLRSDGDLRPGTFEL